MKEHIMGSINISEAVAEDAEQEEKSDGFYKKFSMSENRVKEI